MECHLCGRPTKPTAKGKYRQHNDPARDAPCDTVGTFVPVAEIPEPADYTEERAKVITNALLFSQPAPIDTDTVFSQPGGRPTPPDVIPMTDLGKEITARFKEIFHGYSNRQERSQQATLGPSEIGSPCDRRLAMSLMRMPPVSPGPDGWAAWVGTKIHEGLAEMFMWADAGSGRYASEMPLTFNSEHVPRGTGDLLDRTLFVFEDFKAMGKWSRNKLKSKGPSPTYRVQLHTYALGACQRGEKVEYIALVAVPRDESSLDDLYVWTEPYNPKVALDALARVDRIAERTKELQEERAQWAGLDITAHNGRIAAEFPVADDCKFCSWHQPNAETLEGGGCNGRA